jgi:heat-inducible transcriptional repressor
MMMEPLTRRQQEILSVVVRDYIATAKPVGSDTIRGGYGLSVSPATIRAELAELTEMGYLMQPHTSAGRVPTAAGYRYFVEKLMEGSELSVSEQLLIRHQFHQVSLDLEQWMKLAAAVLAHVSQSAALIAAPQSREVRFRHVELVSISERTGLMIVVLQDSSVHQQVMMFSSSIGQEELSRVSNKLNTELANCTMEQASTQSESRPEAEPSSLEDEVARQVADVMHSHEVQARRPIYRDGLVHILRQPEFDEITRARQIVQVLEQNSVLEGIFQQAHLVNGVQVIIGSEGKWEEIQGCSMVLSGYGLPGEADGVLGVLGPMRMPYGRAISAVRYVADLMSDMMHRLYGEQPGG